jgi:hypothetical protein
MGELMNFTRYQVEVSYYSNGFSKTFFFKRNAIEWLKNEAVKDYLIMRIKDFWSGKEHTIRNRYDNYTFYMDGGCVSMVKKDKPFDEDNWEI